jgi:hypothetical protein
VKLCIQSVHRGPVSIFLLFSVLNYVISDAPTVCQLYTSPQNGDKVNSSTSFTFSWNPYCFSPAPQYVNIILTSPEGQVFQWQQVDAFPGSFDAELDASWWGSTPSILLQVSVDRAHAHNQTRANTPSGRHHGH